MNPSTIHSLRIQIILLAAMGVVLALFVIPTWGLTYWDFGDGNYLYVGQRINDGLVPYRDILAPQPPLHLIMSAVSQRVGGWFGSPMFGARVYCLVVRMLGALMIYLATRRLFGCMFRAMTATAIYLILPIGFWWSLCLQSENLEIVFLMLAFWAILKLDRRWAIWAGVGSALAMHCNMTGVPYFLCNALFLAARRPKLFGWYAGTTLGVWGIGAAGAYAWAGPDYVSNVVLNQVGSFPRSEILGYSLAKYAYDKITGEGWKVLVLEGPLIVVALASIAVRWREKLRDHERNSDEYRQWEYAAWYAIGMMLSICFTAKGGTVNYIFVLGEPAVAIFAADGIVRFARWMMPARVDFERKKALAIAHAVGVPVLLGGVILWPPAVNNLRYTLNFTQVELPVRGVNYLSSLIERHSKPGDSILAPPFYAYVTDRTVAGELAENYLWQIKFVNESFDGVEGEGVLKMREVAAMLRRREVPLVLLDLNQTGRVPFIASAIENYYEPLDPAEFHSRNTRLGLYVPRGDVENF